MPREPPLSNVPSKPDGRTPPTLAHKAARGYAYMLLNTIGVQCVNFFGFIALGWILLERDFGLFALTTTIAAAANLMNQVGLATILVQRSRNFRRWANAAFWLALTLGVGSMLVTAALAPLAQRVYGEEGLTELIIILALSAPFASVATIPQAKLQAQMRFKTLAAFEFGFIAGGMGLTIVFALLDFGAYSFVVPRPIMHAAYLAGAWWVARPAVRLRPQIRRWRYFFVDAAVLTTGNVARYIVNQCDYVILGIFSTGTVVGLYYYAFGLSQRAVVLLTMSLRNVLFPVLSSIQDDPARQSAAFLRTARALVLLGAPACLIQAAVADPIFHTVLPRRMEAAVPVLQVLSVGGLFRLVGQPSLALIRSQGRYPMLLGLSVITGVSFVAAVVAGALLGEALAVAIAVSLHAAVLGPIQVYIGVRHGGGGWRDVLNVFAVPSTTALFAVVPLWLVSLGLPEFPGRDWVILITLPLATAALYFLLIRRTAPGDSADLIARVKELLRRRRA